MKLRFCINCGLYHRTKLCPILTGKLETRWQKWSKSFSKGKWVNGIDQLKLGTGIGLTAKAPSKTSLD